MPGRRLPGARPGMVRAGRAGTAGTAWTAWAAAGIVVVVTTSGGAAMAQDGYRVRPGDTLSTIANRLGVDSGRLASANGLVDPDKIVVGQLLRAPSAATPAPRSTASSGTYRVRPGDTLSQVAPRLGVSEARLAAANSLSNPNNIIAGRSLVVPAAATASPAGATASTTPSPAAASTTPVKVGPSRWVRHGGARCRVRTSSTTTATSSLAGSDIRASTCTRRGSRP
ncbi:MAG: LysM peptidoglycan-binding domain-containing protein [Actinomycetota bacterium]|nr:LysM peptidoglycan-binding domain-containing protein [Actinomycetota bacterium]